MAGAIMGNGWITRMVTHKNLWLQMYRNGRKKTKKPHLHWKERALMRLKWTLADPQKPRLGGNGGIRTLDEALHPILP
jgi:hypothetical protein